MNFVSPPRNVDILGARVDDVTYDEAISICRQAVRSGSRHQVVTPNAEFVVFAQRDHAFREIINCSRLSIPDGHSLLWASRMLGCPLREQVTGTDLAYGLAGLAANEGYSLYLLGGAEGIAATAARKLHERYPGLRVAGTYAGSPALSEEQRIRDKLLAAAPVDILLVAYGAPAQEKWIARNLSHLDVRLAMGVGGVFDFISGRTPRAPRWLRQAGFDWLYRLARQPWRWRRQLTIPQFLWLVLRRRLAGCVGTYRQRE
ncbi:MAG: WecB/TagA/CpsF family glycosyltransferase [Chloroflexi bacterium]|nr:WecB/TagA/CpsF family glycosyltransferase [Chloroflexota bacterium]